MAAGLSRSAKYGRTKRWLQGIVRRLRKRGIRAKYRDWGLESVPPGQFSVYVSWGNMSNGESIGEAVAKVHGKTFVGGGYSGKPSFDEGLREIEDLYEEKWAANPRRRRGKKRRYGRKGKRRR